MLRGSRGSSSGEASRFKAVAAPSLLGRGGAGGGGRRWGGGGRQILSLSLLLGPLRIILASFILASHPYLCYVGCGGWGGARHDPPRTCVAKSKVQDTTKQGGSLSLDAGLFASGLWGCIDISHVKLCLDLARGFRWRNVFLRRNASELTDAIAARLGAQPSCYGGHTQPTQGETGGALRRCLRSGISAQGLGRRRGQVVAQGPIGSD